MKKILKTSIICKSEEFTDGWNNTQIPDPSAVRTAIIETSESQNIKLYKMNSL